MKKVFITGITGFVGYHFLREMRKRNVEVWALCRPENRNLKTLEGIKDVHVVTGSLENISQASNICSEREFDAFYHLAWSGASGSLRSDYNTQLSNVKWTCDCVEAAKQMLCKKIIITGTICERQCDAIEKQASFLTSSYYLLAKRYAHAMSECVARRVEIPLIWCQFYHPIGIFNKKEQLIANTIHKLLQHEKLQFGHGQGLFDVIDVRDLSYALYLIGENELKNDTYFVGSGSAKPLAEYLQIVKDMINPESVMHFGAADVANLPMKREWLDILPFQAETGFEPIYAFQKTIEEMRMWMENEEQYDLKKWFI